MSTDKKHNSFVDKVKEIMTERRADYAHPQDNHGLTAELWDSWLASKYLHQCTRGEKFRVSPEDVCILNVLQKISRLAFATHDDSLMDVIGYAENIAMLRPDQRNRKGDPVDVGAEGGGLDLEDVAEMYRDPNPRKL